MRSHSDSKHEKIQIFCQHCPFNTIWRKAFLHHQRVKHNMYQKKSKHFKDGQTQLCDDCVYSGIGPRFVIHKRRCGGGTKLQCNQCDYSTVHQFTLNRHTKFVHDKFQKTSDGTKLQCNLCNYSTIHQFSLNRHTKFVHKKWFWPNILENNEQDQKSSWML